jgi:guanine deaminase
MCSKAVALQPSPKGAKKGQFAREQLPVATLLYLATLGGAHVCALEKRVGSFAPGKAFDALLVSTRAECGNPAVWGPDVDDALGLGTRGADAKAQLDGMLERFLFGGDDRNIRRVYVEGKVIGGAAQR